MEEIKLKLWETEYAVNHCKYFNSLEDLLLSDNKITSFIIKDRFDSEAINRLFLDEIAREKNITIIYTDLEHPIVYTEIDGFIINSKFFEKEGERLIELCQKNILELRTIRVPKEVFDDSFFDRLVDNIDQIQTENDFNAIVQFDDIELTKEQIQTLNSHHIEAYNYKDNKNYKISKCEVLASYTISDLRNRNYFDIDKPLSEDELKYLKEIKDGSVVKLYNMNGITVIKIVNELEKLNKKVKVGVMNINRKDYPYKEVSKLKLNYVELLFHENSIDLIPLDEYIKQEEIIEIMIKDIKIDSLSPLEKYMAIYEIVKKFKKYKESPNDLIESRDLSYILFNEYIVCVGFSKLLIRLLNEVGINAMDYSVRVDTSYDDGFTKETVSQNLSGHSRVIVYLKDTKYNIDGYYVADPTWDNYLDKNIVVHALMTFDKLQVQKRRNDFNIENAILDNTTFEEFCEKINLILKHNIGQPSKDFMIKLLNNFKNLYDVVMKIIGLDEEAYKEFKTKYPDNSMEVDRFYEFLTDAGYYIVSKTNKRIPAEQLFIATSEVYKKVLNLDDADIEKYMDKMVEDNKQMYKIQFPYHTDLKNEFRLKKGSDKEFDIDNPYKNNKRQ